MGSSPQYSEFTSDGRLLLDADFGGGDAFETSVDVSGQPYVAAQALDADGTVLGTAEVGGE